ncbi:MAG: hypothetical protein QOE64_2457 [Frankiales bacterium]|jgi:sortase (surface protein transpeptidase)|nr:hypothetical protein [Frankiales bacterium]
MAAIVAGVVLVSLGTWVMTQPAFAAVSRGTIPSVDRGHGRSIGLGGVTPTTLTIPAIGVDASVTPVDVEQGGELGVPTSFRAAGWWRSGPGLDRNGPLVLVGHVDDHSGPALFFRLRDLMPGEAVSVAGADRVVRHYVIDAVRQYDKSAFPATLVYGATGRHTLRLITCGGYSFWRLHYKDNVVVFAHEVAA